MCMDGWAGYGGGLWDSWVAFADTSLKNSWPRKKQAMQTQLWQADGFPDGIPQEQKYSKPLS